MKDTFKHKGLRQQLVNVLKNKGITNVSVLAAIGKIPRHLFMDSSFLDHAYQDKAFPIAADQTISQPYTVAFQSELMQIKTGDKILEIGKEMINKPVELLDGVENVLSLLSENYKLVVATKGDLLDQERKLEKSGLDSYFHHIEVLSDKKERNYAKLLDHLDIHPSEFLMIGNSLKSDILPLINLKAHAIHIPFHTTWVHEQVSDEETNGKAYKTIGSLLELLEIVI